MTKQQFEALAAALKRSRPGGMDPDCSESDFNAQQAAMDQWRADVRAIARVEIVCMFPRDTRFYAGFYAACGYDSTKEKPNV